MRLFGKVDGTIDRYDRASWLTLPFDLSYTVATPSLRRLCVDRVRVLSALAGSLTARPALHMTRAKHKPALSGDIDNTCC